MKKGTERTWALAFLAALLAALLAAGCEDTMTEKLKEEVRIAALPIRNLTILAPATGASLTPAAGTYMLKDGEEFAVSATMDSGYTFIQWRQTAGKGVAAFGDSGAASTTLKLTGGDATIQATFAIIYRTLTVTNDGHGSTDPATSAPVGDDLPFTINATPSAGYEFDHWVATVNPSYVAFDNANSASTTVTVTGGNATIRAMFKAGTYAVAIGVNSASYGGVSPSGTQNVTYGNSLSITATVASVDHAFSNWTVSPSGVLSLSSTTAATTTISDVTAAASLTANFAVKTYLLTVSSAEGGYASFSSKTVTANVATGIAAYAYPTYKFTGWEKASGTGTAAFGSASSAATTVALSGGAATIRPTFAKTTPSLALLAGGSAYQTSIANFPKYFAGAVSTSSRLAILGSTTNGGATSMLGYIDISTPTNLMAIIGGWWGIEMSDITTDGTYLFAISPVSAGNEIISLTLSDGQFANVSDGTGKAGGDAIHWDGSRLWADIYLSTSWAVRDVSTSSLKPTGTYTLTDEGGQGDATLSVDGITSSGSQGLILIGHTSVDNTYYNHLSLFRSPISAGVHTAADYRTEDLTSDATHDPWFDMDMDIIRDVGIHPDGELAAVVAPYSNGSFWIKTIDWTTSSLDVLGSVQVCDSTGEVRSCLYTDSYILAAGIMGGKATIWIIDASDPSKLVVRNTYQNASYAGGAFYICRSASSLSTYFVVCKQTASGTENLVILPLTLSEN